ncbi:MULTISPECIES: helix-turn-helix domain-containing protein [unclassified Pseudomonas]|uniref:helix-turn-helix domain-containing protein n=1 Tax=unclassified Pseudomonas TaxID=196821 RepID=UPI00210A6D95|nr:MULTISPECIES: helix-turn-helix transcriptional regulator [unclassified Pseudomonas]
MSTLLICHTVLDHLVLRLSCTPGKQHSNPSQYQTPHSIPHLWSFLSSAQTGTADAAPHQQNVASNRRKFQVYCADLSNRPTDSSLFRKGIGLEISAAFGVVLRRKQKEAGLSQEKLAEKADIQRNYVSLLERGEYQPTIGVIFALATALECSPSALIMEVETMMKAHLAQ